MVGRRSLVTFNRWLLVLGLALAAALVVPSVAMRPMRAGAQTAAQDLASGSGVDDRGNAFAFSAAPAALGPNGENASGYVTYTWSTGWWAGKTLEASIYCLQVDRLRSFMLAEVTASPNAPDVGGSIYVWAWDNDPVGQPDRFGLGLNQATPPPCPAEPDYFLAPELMSGEVFVQDGTLVAPADTTAPLVTGPGSLTGDATGPAGAAVTFAATATDHVDGSLMPTCTPPSGTTFPIGSTAGTCAATDAAGNTGSAGFTVTVRGAADQLADLKGVIQNLNARQGIANSLDAKLASIVAALDAAAAGDLGGACGKIGGLINEVQAQSDKKLTADQAGYLTSEAQRIGAVLGC